MNLFFKTKISKIFFALIAFTFAMNLGVAAAQASLYNGLATPFYDANSSACIPASSSSNIQSALVWPFATKDSKQFNRVDQGWDIQAEAGAAIYAIAPGTIHVFNPDNGNFGNDYPTEELDNDIEGPSKWVYYGHVHVLPAVIGKHVNAGDQIATANTTDPQNGSNAPLGWLEIGFAIPNTDAPVNKSSETVATPGGQKMKDLLQNATPSSGGNVNSQSNSSCGCSTILPGNDNPSKIWNYFVGKGLSNQQTAGIMGNIEQESSFIPTRNQKGGNSDNPSDADPLGWGLIQWTPGSKIIEAAQQAGITGPIDDLATQLDLIWQHMQNHPPITTGSFSISDFKNINDEKQAAIYFRDNIEGGSDPNGIRETYATELLQQYQNSNAGGQAVSSCQSSGSTQVSGSCTVDKPVYDAQYSQTQLAQIFGDPGTADSHPDLHLVSVNFLGHSADVSPLVAPCLEAVSNQLQSENINYTITQFGCYRFDSNNGGSNIGLESYHTYGAACDINWDSNPWSGDGSSKPHDMPQAYIQAFHDHGFTWGGDWTSVKDYMHFEWHGVVPQQ